MKRLQLLKWLTTIFLFWIVASAWFQLSQPTLHLINPSHGMPLYIDGFEITGRSTTAMWLIHIANTAIHLIFLYAIFQIYRVISELVYVKIFENKVVKSLTLAGNALIIYTILNKLLNIIVLQDSSNVISSMSSTTVHSAFFPIVVGLLLNVFGVIIKISKYYKDETHLTV